MATPKLGKRPSERNFEVYYDVTSSRMTQRAAAKKHGIAQPMVCKIMKQVRRWQLAFAPQQSVNDAQRNYLASDAYAETIRRCVAQASEAYDYSCVGHREEMPRDFKQLGRYYPPKHDMRCLDRVAKFAKEMIEADRGRRQAQQRLQSDASHDPLWRKEHDLRRQVKEKQREEKQRERIRKLEARLRAQKLPEKVIKAGDNLNISRENMPLQGLSEIGKTATEKVIGSEHCRVNSAANAAPPELSKSAGLSSEAPAKTPSQTAELERTSGREPEAFYYPLTMQELDAAMKQGGIDAVRRLWQARNPRQQLAPAPGTTATPPLDPVPAEPASRPRGPAARGYRSRREQDQRQIDIKVEKPK